MKCENHILSFWSIVHEKGKFKYQAIVCFSPLAKLFSILFLYLFLPD